MLRPRVTIGIRAVANEALEIIKCVGLHVLDLVMPLLKHHVTHLAGHPRLKNSLAVLK